MMREDWKERRTKQIRVRICAAAAVVTALCAVCAWKHVHAVSALEVSEVQRKQAATMLYDFETLLKKQSNFTGNQEDHETRQVISKFCTNIEDWSTELTALDVEFVHMLQVGEENIVLDHSYCVTDNNTHMTHLSTADSDMWYDLENNKCYVKPMFEKNFYGFDSIDVFGRQAILDKSLYGSAVSDVTSILSFILRNTNKVSKDVNGNVSIMSNGLINEMPVNGVNEASESDTYSAYALLADNSIYVHLQYTYVTGDFSNEDIWYRISRSDTPVEFPTAVTEDAVKTNRALETIVRGGE